MAAQTEVRMCDKYCHLLSSHTFEPVAIATSGAIRPRTSARVLEGVGPPSQAGHGRGQVLHLPPPTSLGCYSERERSIHPGNPVNLNDFFLDTHFLLLFYFLFSLPFVLFYFFTYVIVCAFLKQLQGPQYNPIGKKINANIDKV